MTNRHDAIIIGGGLAGLICAGKLSEQGLSCQLLEATDRVGGRVATDLVDGFLLDRGFQVFLTAYPEAKQALDYDDLKLCRFEPGALIRYNGRFHRMADPWRRPQHIVATALSPTATLGDKMRIASFRRSTTRGELSDLYERPEQTTIALLRERGFSDVIIERFFRPFLGGVFLDRDLKTSSRLCEFVFRMFSLGDAAVPEMGMGEIPAQLFRRLPRDVVRTNSRVASLEGHEAVLSNGERLSARAVILATEEPIARGLLGESSPSPGRSVTCLYFSADVAPLNEPILVLNGDGTGPINNLCVPSQVSRRYAPPDMSLLSVTVLDEHQDHALLLSQVRSQLADWFGTTATTWHHLKTYSIRYALPAQTPPTLQPVAKRTTRSDGLFICGDYCDTASINGAMAAGRRAAEAVLATLKTE